MREEARAPARPRESLRTRLLRWGFNLFPALVASGGRLTYIADDFSVVGLKLKKCLRTRNYVGTMYGGSMYAAVDGIYMVMLIRLLGRGYEVWDMGGGSVISSRGAPTCSRGSRSTLKNLIRSGRGLGQSPSWCGITR